VNYVHERDNRDSLSHNSAVALYEDSQGTLWVGTYGGGLNRFHREDQKFTHYREKDGLQNDAAIAITEDEQGDLWIGTNKGLSRFDPRSETFRGYDSTDGVAGDVFGIGAAFRGSSGELFFGSEGVTAFFPNRLVDDPVPPTVVLTDFHLFYEPVPLTRSAPDSPLKQDILFTDSLTLNHRQYVFALEFAGLHFAEPRKNRYAYQLENFDASWVETDARNRRIQYSNLKPGNYTFRVRASNKDGKWNDRGAALQITVLPPPWKTWWAMGLYALTLALALGSSLRWQQRRVERERKISARLREVDRLKDEFLANTSHELRTPLYGIIGLAEALSEGVAGKMSSKALSHLEMVVASGRRLTGLVNDILDFSRLSHKSLDLDRQAVDLNTLTDVVLTLSQPLVGTKKLTLNNAIDPRLPAADADENRVQQILLNLVSNAIKFTTEGHIEISAMAEEGRLEIRVKDTGIGISETDLDRIFESFEQVDSAIDRAHGGTGLGLAVARQLVSLHGGNLWVESALGSGSTFFFTLPLSADQTPFKFREQSSEEIFLGLLNNEQEAAQSNDSAPPRPSGETPSLPHTSLPEGETQTSDKTEDHCILVVDDEPVIREVLVASLTAEGYRVLSVSSGLEALRLLAEAEVDLILLDVMMPQMSGYKVCRAIRRQHSLEELPIIFLTARTQVDDMLAGFSEGANDYLAKPIARGELVARVKTHLKLYDQHRKRAARMKVLRGLLPICGGCKKIRDDDGYWNELESYLEIHSEAQLSHGLCPDCVHDLYPGVDVRIQPQPDKPVK
jgi:signal transduction histidine kinase/FixJ family two-component response regulator